MTSYVPSTHEMDYKDLLLERRAEIQVKGQPHGGGRVGAKRGHKDTELHGTCSAHEILPPPCCLKNMQSVCVCFSVQEKEISQPEK